MGEVVFGGVGSGMYGMLLFVVVAVFIAGLMVGRTPEYLGRKIGAREIKLTMIGVLVMPIGAAGDAGGRRSRPSAGTASIFNAGPQGFAEAFYAYNSQFNNNGSAFAGYGATEFSTTLGGVAMLFGRFVPILAILAIAGALSTQEGRARQRGHPADDHAHLRGDADLRDHPGRRADLHPGARARAGRHPALGGRLLMGRRPPHLSASRSGWSSS